ncbi:asparagine synthase (glutamine-hydrolysing) [Belliella buryatensis]|uniref:asparagine synthase (glutamine-hydrolyzing) n=1 Tax=Belliella buryatensis TaxID=1500549 RepID=A0A239E981_9BACT|nr:asparagine synthase (glutamine-hydrolyzing) [Belliella buryatensis]SNS41039.1 asparagine synthase (glutamine-hydrolysing) [Belliella buryatensis]
MCGISLLIDNSPKAEQKIRRMMSANLHRGPDHSEYNRVSDKVWVAGNRLKILDLSDASNQPIWDEKRRCVLVWNGALYNYQDLRNQLLDLGFTFKTSSDSEVFLNWLKAHGKTGIQSLKGMYSFVFVNLDLEEIIIARDPSGEKPLFYYQKDSLWVFSSEARGVKAGLDIGPNVDGNQFLPYFYSRHSFPDQSFYKDIRQFLPGEGLKLDLKGNYKEKFSWKHEAINKESFSQQLFESKLKDAVLKNFHTERNVGVILSGGADSSLLYQLWLEETGQPMPTFTATFEKTFQKKYQDPIYARKLTSQHEGFHHEVHINLEKVKANWQEYIESLDQPVGDSASLLTWMIGKEAKSDVQVLISGAGADELLGGYQRHSAYKFYLRNKDQLLKLKSYILWLPLPRRVRKFLASIKEDPKHTFLNFASLSPIPEDIVKQFLSWYPDGSNTYSAALNFDRNYYLINDILKVHDNACMAHGIEGRAPYLDFDLIAWITSFSDSEHLNICGKLPIKSALTSRGMQMIAKRKKLGFGLPLEEWIAKDKTFQNWIYPEIKAMYDKWGQYFPLEMQSLCKSPEKASKDQFLLIWNMFILASWLRVHA